METKSSHVWVGAVTLALLALLAAGIVWIARLSGGTQDTYDIFFPQSVEGLGKGSSVSYNGVPAGQVTDIQLARSDPGLVRVRIAVSDKIPMLQGTTATLQGSFTGVSTIQLNGGVKGAGDITQPGREGVPEIPPRRSGLGDLLSNAPQLMARLTNVADRLGRMFSDENLNHIDHIFANTDAATKSVAAAAPELKAMLADLDATLLQANLTLAEYQRTAQGVNAQLDPNGNSAVHKLNDTLEAARQSADALRAAVNDTRPVTRRLGEQTLPQAEAAIADLRATTAALRALTEKIDDQGVAGVMGSPKLPVYHP